MISQNSSGNDTDIDDLEKDIDDLFLASCGIFLMFIQSGFACLEAGSIQKKNSGNITLKCLLDLVISAFTYYLFGFALSYGTGNCFMGLTLWAGIGYQGSILGYWFFQYMFASTSATIVSGSVAERCNFSAYIIYSGVISGFVYPIAWHWVWSDGGWLKCMGYTDFAGAGAVHGLGGACALVAAWFLGPRIGRVSPEGKFLPNLPINSGVLVGLGGMLLMTGFLGFNAGSLGHIAEPGDSVIVSKSLISTLGGGSGGAAVILLFGRLGYFTSHWPIGQTMNGLLVGMVSICGAPEDYNCGDSILCGMIACLVYLGLCRLEILLKVDDPMDAFPIHFGGGYWGVIAGPILSKDDGLMYGGGMTALKNLGINALGITTICAWGAVCSVILFGGLSIFKIFRVKPEVELRGLDECEHGVGPSEGNRFEIAPATPASVNDKLSNGLLVAKPIEDVFTIPVDSVTSKPAGALTDYEL